MRQYPNSATPSGFFRITLTQFATKIFVDARAHCQFCKHTLLIFVAFQPLPVQRAFAFLRGRSPPKWLRNIRLVDRDENPETRRTRPSTPHQLLQLRLRFFASAVCFELASAGFPLPSPEAAETSVAPVHAVYSFYGTGCVISCVTPGERKRKKLEEGSGRKPLRTHCSASA